MAAIDILAFIHLADLSAAEKKVLTKRLRDRQKQLKFATRAVNRALGTLKAKAARRKKTAKRKTRRRKR
jgi:hypothetical protein